MPREFTVYYIALKLIVIKKVEKKQKSLVKDTSLLRHPPPTCRAPQSPITLKFVPWFQNCTKTTAGMRVTRVVFRGVGRVPPPGL
jgi:hypothetical protein